MYYLTYRQRIPLSLEESWEFFSSLQNLKILTPKQLNFQTTSPHVNKMYAGQIISYTVCPLWNLPIEWITEITHVKELDYFIDEQRFGPYKFWHHEHRFKPLAQGVEIEDIVCYKMPFGPLGKILHALKVKKDLVKIFSFRHAKLIDLFGAYPL